MKVWMTIITTYMFKIVQTVEEEEICLTAVPSSWEKDGILFWPKKNIISRLVRDANSTPGIEWTKMACVVKRTAATYAEAESELAYMESQPDTDQEAPTVIEPPAPKKQRIELPDFDLNQMLESAAFEQNGIEDIHEVLSTTPTVSPAQPDLNTVLEELREIRRGISIIQNNQGVLEQNQTKMAHGMARMDAKIDFVLGEPGAKLVATETPEKIMTVINTKDEFDDFEKKLEGEQFRLSLIDGMSFICGTTGREKGVNCAYKLIDYFFTREFLTKCSWTGAARTQEGDSDTETTAAPASANEPAKEKVPFKFYNRTRHFFLSLINKADSSFSELATDKFFKTGIKNSVQRLHAKAQTSTTKNRPGNLKYKKKSGGQESPTDE